MLSQEDGLSIADGEWKPIPRISRVIPFGYELSPDDPSLLLPIEFELKALQQAKKHLRNFSYRDVANWLSTVTGRSISHMGLKKRMEIELSRRRKAQTIKQWSRRLEEAKAKVEELEKGHLGAKT